jgi:hypothetical protein
MADAAIGPAHGGHGSGSDRIQNAISAKIAFGQTTVTAAMTWWVSSVVFCGSIIAGAWLKEAEIHQLGTMARCVLCSIVLVFFLSVVTFGFLTARAFQRLAREIGELRTSLVTAPDQSTGRAWEFDFAAKATYLGTSSFLLIALTWCVISAQLIFSRPICKSTSPPQPQSQGVLK